MNRSASTRKERLRDGESVLADRKAGIKKMNMDRYRKNELGQSSKDMQGTHKGVGTGHKNRGRGRILEQK